MNCLNEASHSDTYLGGSKRKQSDEVRFSKLWSHRTDAVSECALEAGSSGFKPQPATNEIYLLGQAPYQAEV